MHTLHRNNLTQLVIASLALLSLCECGSFVQRNGSSLVYEGKPFVYAGCNMYWLGLDENEPPHTVNYPTHFRVDDAMVTAKNMGARVVRGHTLGVSTGNPKSYEQALNEWNSNASDHIDYAISRADKFGIKLIIPLTDNVRASTVSALLCRSSPSAPTVHGGCAGIATEHFVHM